MDVDIHKRLCYCNICKHRETGSDYKTHCLLTNQFAEFKDSCIDFKFDVEEFTFLRKKRMDDIKEANIREYNKPNNKKEGHWELYDDINPFDKGWKVKLPENILIKPSLFMRTFMYTFILVP